MNDQSPSRNVSFSGKARIGDSALAAKLRREVRGDVMFDSFSRGRYATDASVYQMEPIGVVVPENGEDVRAAMQIARDEGISVLPRGGGTSQCGQTVNHSLVLDLSKHMNRLISVDAENRAATVEPGIVLDQLNAQLKDTGLWFPVDVSTSSRATIGGMTGNNSCGSRSIRYGTMRDNVSAIDAILADGAAMRFGAVDPKLVGQNLPSSQSDLLKALLDLGGREAKEIEARFPDLMRRVGGYNIDALVPGADNNNLSHLLVGSEGTLAFSEKIDLILSPQPKNKVLGICHFPTFRASMEAPEHIVKLDPVAVELMDKTMIDLARDIPMFRPTLERFVQGEPAALLLVEFAEEDQDENLRRLRRLVELMADLGFPGGVVEAIDPGFQKAVWEVRKQGLNIMMSMKTEGKPVSFVEDCAVRLEDLADYTSRLTDVFHKHGTEGTWYAHASVGTLHVRPVLNLKQELDVKAFRAIAEEAFEMVREYKGSHSGEHGDGIVRSEFHEPMFGNRMIQNFGEVKTAFDPGLVFNPNKIVDPPKMDDRELFRFKPDYQASPLETAFDWSDWGGFQGAVEMCNNNGACRKASGGVMCPSFRATGNEKDLTRGRANTLRLALSGQLDMTAEEALTSDEMAETLKLCVGCKGCKQECPTGVDMAKFKIEVDHLRAKTRGISLRDKLVAYLPRYAPALSRFYFLANLRDQIPGLATISEWITGFSAKRTLPKWHAEPFLPHVDAVGPEDGTEVALLADSFNRYFEPANLQAAVDVLVAGGYRVLLPSPPGQHDRPLCCGRTFLSAGLVDEARAEAERTRAVLKPLVDRGVPILGLEPSCLFTLKDEWPALFADGEAAAISFQAMLFEEFLARESDAGRLKLPLKSGQNVKALLHGHCHQKAFSAMGAVAKTLGLVPDLEVETIESSCCGMAGSFGYQAETYEASVAMAEASLVPAVKSAAPDTLIVADGTSCRHQIEDLGRRETRHVAVVLKDHLK